MKLIQRIIAKLVTPLLGNLREEVTAEIKRTYENSAQAAETAVRKSELKIRQDLQAELKRVGNAIGEIQSRVPFTTQTADNLASLRERLASIEQILIEASEPRKPGNHIRPAHEFGNRVRL